MTDLRSRHVECAQLPFELDRIVDHRRKIGEWDQLTVIENPTYEAGVAVPALLSVRQNIDARAQLGVDAESYCVIRGGLKLGSAEPAFEMIVRRPKHPPRPRPAANPHDGQRREARRGRRARE